MAEILINSQSPITHKIFWNGEVGTADTMPVVGLYDVTMDPSVNPAISPNTLLATLTPSIDENNPGTYIVNIPYQYTDRNKTLRLVWNYTVNGTVVKKSDEIFVITPYVDFNHAQDLGFSTDSSDPGYKSYKDLLMAEKYARKKIEEYTGQDFYLHEEVYVVYGHGSDTLPLPERITELYQLHVNDILLLDNIADVNNWSYDVVISESGYGIRINRANMLDSTVYTANGMVPPSINDSSGVFQLGATYKVYGRFGWASVPDNVELAAIELMKDFFSNDKEWRNKYIKSIQTFDWKFDYNGSAFSGTGNSYADQLLSEYVITKSVII
jgi:hypothetical protein